MPSNYAHHRFGIQVFPSLPPTARRSCFQFRRLFDFGLQGPDFFFYHNFMRKTKLVKLGSMYHQMSGREFFGNICRRLRSEASEADRAYLYGLLGHYCLDKSCHPFVYGTTEDGVIGHSELETEFDRYLMELDGVRKPHGYHHFTAHRMKRKERKTVAGFFPEAQPKDIRRCTANMALLTRALATPCIRGGTKLVTAAAGGEIPGMVMTIGPNPRCAHLNGNMMQFYEKAVTGFPGMLERLQNHLERNIPLDDAFAPNFDRG